MTPPQTVPNRVVLTFQAIFSPLFWQVIGVLLLTIAVFGNLFYFFERRGREGEHVIKPVYFEGGLEDSVWWAGSIMTSMGSDIAPKTLPGRIFNLLVFIVALVISSIIGATITASLTVNTLSGAKGIQSVNDLVGVRVGVVAGTTSATYMQDFRANVVEFPDIASLEAEFETGSLPAIVYDDPVLRYYLQNNPTVGQFVGTLFDLQDYGIIFPLGSPLRLQVNDALSIIQANGLYQVMFDKWFGSSSDDGSSSETFSLLEADDNALIITYALVFFFFALIGISFLFNRKKKQRDSAEVNTSNIQLGTIGLSSSTPIGIESSSNSPNPDLRLILEELRSLKEIVAKSNIGR